MFFKQFCGVESEKWYIEINRNKKNEGLEETSSFNLQKNRSKTSVTGQSPLSQKTNEEDFTSINIIAWIKKM